MRLVAAYRWELWLLVGIPCIRLAGAPLVETFLDAYSGSPADTDDAVSRLAAARAAASIAAVAAAALSYVRVRRQERELLLLIWAYVVGNSTLITALHIWFFEQWDSSGGLDPALRLVISASPITLGYWALYAWLIWRASRLSLAHALLLAALAHLLTGIEISVMPYLQWTVRQAAAGGLIGLAAGGVMAGLTAAFDVRAAEFRKKAVAALVIVGAAADATIRSPLVSLWILDQRVGADEWLWVCMWNLLLWTFFLAGSLSELIIPFALVFLIYAARHVAKGGGGSSLGSA